MPLLLPLPFTPTYPLYVCYRLFYCVFCDRVTCRLPPRYRFVYRVTPRSRFYVCYAFTFTTTRLPTFTCRTAVTATIAAAVVAVTFTTCCFYRSRLFAVTLRYPLLCFLTRFVLPYRSLRVVPRVGLPFDLLPAVWLTRCSFCSVSRCLPLHRTLPLVYYLTRRSAVTVLDRVLPPTFTVDCGWLPLPGLRCTCTVYAHLHLGLRSTTPLLFYVLRTYLPFGSTFCIRLHVYVCWLRLRATLRVRAVTAVLCYVTLRCYAPTGYRLLPSVGYRCYVYDALPVYVTVSTAVTITFLPYGYAWLPRSHTFITVCCHHLHYALPVRTLLTVY